MSVDAHSEQLQSRASAVEGELKASIQQSHGLLSEMESLEAEYSEAAGRAARLVAAVEEHFAGLRRCEEELRGAQERHLALQGSHTQLALQRKSLKDEFDRALDEEARLGRTSTHLLDSHPWLCKVQQ